MTQNAFGITSPEKYECFVRRFNIGHSTMHVAIRSKSDGSNLFYVVFSSVEYFSGAIRWNGANFVVKSDEEALSILRRVDRLAHISDEKLLAVPSYQLYEVTTLMDTVQIVARKATMKSHSEI